MKSKCPKPDKPKPKRACLEIPNHKSQIPNKEVPFGHIFESFDIENTEVIDRSSLTSPK
jgi:hypothetical protein